MINNLNRNGCLVKITELIPSNDGKIWGAKIFLGKTQNIIDWPVNRLYPVETNFQFVLKGDKQFSDQKDETDSRPKWNAVKLAKLRIKYASGINWRGAVLNISDTHWKLKINHMSSIYFYLVNLVKNLCWYNKTNFLISYSPLKKKKKITLPIS